MTFGRGILSRLGAFDSDSMSDEEVNSKTQDLVLESNTTIINLFNCTCSRWCGITNYPNFPMIFNLLHKYRYDDLERIRDIIVRHHLDKQIPFEDNGALSSKAERFLCQGNCLALQPPDRCYSFEQAFAQRHFHCMLRLIWDQRDNPKFLIDASQREDYHMIDFLQTNRFAGSEEAFSQACIRGDFTMTQHFFYHCYDIPREISPLIASKDVVWHCFRSYGMRWTRACMEEYIRTENRECFNLALDHGAPGHYKSYDLARGEK